MCLCSPSPPQLDFIVPEYGYACTLKNIYDRQVIPCRCPRRVGRACTVHRILLTVMILPSVLAIILAAVAASDREPWLTLTSYNGTASDAATWSFTDEYALSGATRTRICPYNGGQNHSSCVDNPFWYTPIPLTEFSRSVVTVGTATTLRATTALALTLTLVALSILIFGLLPSVPFPASTAVSATVDPAGQVSRLIIVTCAVQIAGVALEAASLGTYDANIYNLVKSNATVVTTTPSGQDMATHIKLAHGSGYATAAASIAFLAVTLILTSVVVFVAPRWWRGTRVAYYEAAMRAAIAAGALPPEGVPVPVAMVLPPATGYPMPTAGYPMLTTGYPMLTNGYPSPFAQTTGYVVPVAQPYYNDPPPQAAVISLNGNGYSTNTLQPATSYPRTNPGIQQGPRVFAGDVGEAWCCCPVQLPVFYYPVEVQQQFMYNPCRDAGVCCY